MLGYLEAGFGGVGAVIEADAHDLVGRRDRRQQGYVGEREVGLGASGAGDLAQRVAGERCP